MRSQCVLLEVETEHNREKTRNHDNEMKHRCVVADAGPRQIREAFSLKPEKVNKNRETIYKWDKYMFYSMVSGAYNVKFNRRNV